MMNGLTLKDILREMVFSNKRWTARQIAEQLGCSYSMLCNACNGELDEWKFAARYIAPITNLTGDYRLLDFLEARVGRVAFDLPALPDLTTDQNRVDSLITKNTQLFGETLGHIGEALRDGHVDDFEIKRIEASLLDQVRTAMAMLQALKGGA